MDNDLNHLKQTFKSLKKTRLKRYLMLSGFVLILTVFWLWTTTVRSKTHEDENKNTVELVCRISKEQKQKLLDRINQIASCGKTSKASVFKALKRYFKYETISKMPCKNFDEAEKILTDLNARFCD